MDSTVKERLIEYIKFKKISKSEFGRRIGVSNAYISSMRKSMDPDKIKSISLNFPDLNIGWLLTGEGEMLAQSSSSPSLEATSVALSSEAILSKTIEMLAESNRVLAETNRRLVEKLSNLQGDTAK